MNNIRYNLITRNSRNPTGTKVKTSTTFSIGINFPSTHASGLSGNVLYGVLSSTSEKVWKYCLAREKNNNYSHAYLTVAFIRFEQKHNNNIMLFSKVCCLKHVSNNRCIRRTVLCRYYEWIHETKPSVFSIGRSYKFTGRINHGKFAHSSKGSPEDDMS